MNTRKQVLIMSALLALMLVVIGIYGAWYPNRQTGAEAYFEESTAKRGAITFARNCRLCHGDVGEGGSAGSRLPAAPALNRSQLQGFVPLLDSEDAPVTLTDGINARVTTLEVSDASKLAAGATILIDSERMEIVSVSGSEVMVKRAVGHTTASEHIAETPIELLDRVTLTEQMQLMTDAIACGRVGTAMPAWSIDHGGPLNDEQIRQIVVMIAGGYWDKVQAENDHEDERSALAGPVERDAVILDVKDVASFNEGEAYRIGGERIRVDMKVVTPGQSAGSIVVQRGVLGTVPLDHAEGETVYLFPEVGEPQTLQYSCGQTARPSAPPEEPTLVEPFDGPSLEIIALGVAFDLNELRAPANTEIRVRLDNQEPVEHNIAFYQSRTELTPLAPEAVGTLFVGPEMDDTVFTTPDAGSYFFRCDVHPTTMTGTFIVE